MTYDEADVDQLGERLAALPLNVGERNALQALISFAVPYPADTPGLGELDQAAGLKQELRRALLEPSTI